MSERKRIIRFHAENVKRLTAVDITPTGNLVVIGGDNGQGKTSVLDSIAMVLSGKEIPPVPVHRGAEKAVIIADLGDLVVKRTFTAKGGTALMIENKEGLRYQSPQTLLDKLTGRLTFDPLAFLKLEPAQQAEQLRKLVGLDFTALHAERQQLYEERTLVNRDHERAQHNYEALAHYPEAPAEPIDTSKLVEELAAAQAHNRRKSFLHQAVERAEDAMAQHTRTLARCDDAISEIEAEIQLLQKRLAERQEQRRNTVGAEAADRNVLNSAREEWAAFESRDEAPIRAQLADSAKINQQVHANVIRADAVRAIQQKKANADALTAQIEAIDRQKREQLAAVTYPIAGLSFNEDGVMFDGLPFEQASAADQLRASVAIAAALNPKLGVMIVRDGSLMDDRSMALLAELAQKHDLQVWVERVGNGEHVGVLIVDGTVAEAPIPEPRNMESVSP